MATIKELFHAMPAYANESAIEGIDKTIQFVVTGEESGEYYLVVSGGEVESHEGRAANPDVTITTPADVWMQISSGEMNGAVAYMTGKFKAQGDLPTLMAMQGWFSLPQ